MLALLPEYASLEDPVADLRAACLDAVRWLGGGFGVHGSWQGLRIARTLAEEAGVPFALPPEDQAPTMLVVANGTATRTEKAPGHLDERAAGFDDDLRAALTTDPRLLADLDVRLAGELWADVDSLVWLGQEIDVDPASVQVDYDDDPNGVQYWVMRMEGRWR
ncbi:MAG: hypothetical protein Q7J48_02475 [Nocardioides sp.]|nr:hypothetical protein [Nocardioides sp.]